MPDATSASERQLVGHPQAARTESTGVRQSIPVACNIDSIGQGSGSCISKSDIFLFASYRAATNMNSIKPPTTQSPYMSNPKTNILAIILIFSLISSVFGQWSPVDSGTTSNLNGAILLDSGTGFVVGDTGTILKSTDAGATWAPLTSGTSTTLHGIYFLDPNEGIAVGDNAKILRTTDGGAAWQSITSGVEDSLRSVSFSGVNGICGGDSQTILYSTDSGTSWQISQSGFFGGGFPGAQMLSATTGFVAGQNSIFQALVGKTTDGGASWA